MRERSSPPRAKLMFASVLYLCVGQALTAVAAEDARGPASGAATSNLIRNGSFEGTLKYWMIKGAVDQENPAFGQFSARVEDGSARSSSFALEPGRAVRISFSVRAEKDGQVGLCVAPSERGIAQAKGYAWNFKLKTPVGKEWTRSSFTFTPQNVSNNWMPDCTWILMISGPKPFWLDGVSVAREGGEAAYLPRRPVEVTSDAPDLAPYTETGRLLKLGDKANVRACAHNATDREQKVTLRWQWLDYEGKGPLGRPIDRPATLAPGQTAIESAEMALEHRGLQLARVTALDAEGKGIDSSDEPLTALPFPKRATTPDPRERFGGSFRGPLTTRLAQQIGFRWCRWWWGPMGWSSVQPDGPDTWKWEKEDERIGLLLQHGMSLNYVMYSVPKWAKGDKNLPKDMPWEAGDPRWDDLSVQTAWDGYVTKMVQRYADKPIVWEFSNEPDIHTPRWDPALYFALVKRTSQVIKRANPKAFFLINCTWPGVTPLQQDFFRRGGAKLIDAYSWHNYSPGVPADADAIREMRRWLKLGGNESAQVWFNEGWTFVNTSQDYAALPLTDKTPAEWAHMTVRNVADLFAAGLDRFILFHIGYEQHGRSWWDWVGSGTELWDDNGYPTIAVSVWNVLAENLGLGDFVATVLPPNAVLHVFEDKRTNRGLVVAWARKGDCTLELPVAGLVARDVMGNDTPLKEGRPLTSQLTLRGDGTPVCLYPGLSWGEPPPGQELARCLAPLDEAAQDRAAGRVVYRVPFPWEGTKAGSTDGNPALVEGKPTWRLDQVWPDDPMKPENYRPMPWSGTAWRAVEHTHGGQPGTSVGPNAVELVVRTGWPGQPGNKICALIFLARMAGLYRLRGTVCPHIWDSGAPIALLVLRMDRRANQATRVAQVPLKSGLATELGNIEVALEADQELVLLPTFTGPGLVAYTCRLEDFRLTYTPARRE